jgi:hypothetical protein
MKVNRPRRQRDPRIRYVTALKIDRLEARIERLIRADIEAHDERVRVAAFAASTDGVPRLASGLRDRRTSAYRAWKAARDAAAALAVEST